MSGRFFRTNGFYIPFIIGAILVFSSFAPVLQVMMLYGNGGLIYPIGKVLSNLSDDQVFKIFNISFSLIGLLGYYYSKNFSQQLLWAIILVFFLHNLIVLEEIKLNNGGDSDPYYLQFIISGVLSVLPLFVVGFINERKKLRLKNVLEKVIEHLNKSEDSDWSPLTAKQVIKNLQVQIDRIDKNQEVDKDILKVEFAPTSTIQEISMANGWSEKFLKLASEFDDLI